MNITIADIKMSVRDMKIPMSDLTRFITFTLKPKYYKYNINLQRELTQNVIASKLRDHTVDFVLVSELTVQGNVHYHAIATFKSQIHYIKWNDSLKGRTSIGFHRVTPNPISHYDNMVRSKEYLLKDLELTEKVIKPNMIMRQRDDYIFN